ncbi:MAG: 2OG-Fe(II) oxygenase family protein [Pseudomonadota bacterium]
MLNQHDEQALSREFETDRRLRISNFLLPGYADSLEQVCSDQIEYEYAFAARGENKVLSAAELAQLSSEEQAKLQEQLTQDASRGVGFFYGSYMMGRKRQSDADAPPKALVEFLDLLNSPQMLSFVNTITGGSDVVVADMQCTRYMPGNYLTRHKDDVAGQTRRFAYVFSITKQWHPDWGGLLQFFEADGTPRDAWAPAMNTLSLFDVEHVHSVTYVAPFAVAPRLSITGWYYSR